MAIKTVSFQITGIDQKQGVYGTGKPQTATLNFSGINYNPANREIKKITMTYQFGGSGSGADGKRLYFWNGSASVGYVEGSLYKNTKTFEFDKTTNTAIFDFLCRKFAQSDFIIQHYEPSVRGWHNSSNQSTRYSYDWLNVLGCELVIDYEELAYVYYGVNGEWQKCLVYYAVGGGENLYTGQEDIKKFTVDASAGQFTGATYVWCAILPIDGSKGAITIDKVNPTIRFFATTSIDYPKSGDTYSSYVSQPNGTQIKITPNANDKWLSIGLLRKDQDQYELFGELQKGAGHYIALNVGIGNPVNYTTYINSEGIVAHGIIPVSAGDQFIISGTGGGVAYLWGLTDTNYNLLRSSGTKADQTDYALDVAKDGYLIINMTNTDPNRHSLIKKIPIREAAEGLTVVYDSAAANGRWVQTYPRFGLNGEWVNV